MLSLKIKRLAAAIDGVELTHGDGQLGAQNSLGATWHVRVCRCLKPDFQLRAAKGVNGIQINRSSARCKKQGKSVTAPADFRP
jgi:hypothetical protein